VYISATNICAGVSFKFSILFVACFPWFFLPIIEQCITFTGNCLLPILETCPNHVNICCAILSTNVLSWRRMLRTVSFLILSRLDTRNSLLNHVISAVMILLLHSCLQKPRNRCRQADTETDFSVNRSPKVIQGHTFSGQSKASERFGVLVLPTK